MSAAAHAHAQSVASAYCVIALRDPADDECIQEFSHGRTSNNRQSQRAKMTPKNDQYPGSTMAPTGEIEPSAGARGHATGSNQRWSPRTYRGRPAFLTVAPSRPRDRLSRALASAFVGSDTKKMIAQMVPRRARSRKPRGLSNSLSRFGTSDLRESKNIQIGNFSD